MAGLFTHVGDDSLLVIETPPVEEFSGDHAGFYAHNPVGGEQEIIDAYSWALVSESFALDAQGYAADALASLVSLDNEVALAAASAAAAAASEIAAAASALAASTDADDASASAIAAGLSEDAASASATAAGLSETAAAGSASAASSSASAASGSASAASASAAAALISEGLASGYADAAAASAAAAATFDPALYTSLAGTQTITGWKTFEAASGNSLVTIQKAGPSNQAVLDFRDDAGVQRNIFGLAGVAADDFFIGRYNDAGAWQGSIMYVPAATGIADFQYTPTVGGVALAKSNETVNLTGTQTITGFKTFSHTEFNVAKIYRSGASSGAWYAGLQFETAIGVGGTIGFNADGDFSIVSAASALLVTWDNTGTMTAGTVPWARLSDVPTSLSNTVNLTGDQSITGVKTFNDEINVEGIGGHSAFNWGVLGNHYLSFQNTGGFVRFRSETAPSVYSNVMDVNPTGLSIYAGKTLTIGAHTLAEQSTSMLRHQSASATATGLAHQTSDGTTRGYSYATSSNEIGFLNNAGSWILRLDSSGIFQNYVNLDNGVRVSLAGSSGNNTSREIISIFDDRTDRRAGIGTYRGAASTRIGLSFWGSFDAAPVERMRLDDSGTLNVITGRLITAISSNYGSMQVDWQRNGWAGYNIGGRHVFMDQGGTQCGIYNETNSQWMIQCYDAGRVELCYAGAVKFQTTATGTYVSGDMSLASSDTTLSRLSAGQIGVEGKAVLTHGGAYTGGKVTVSTSAPTGGSNGDVWFKI